MFFQSLLWFLTLNYIKGKLLVRTFVPDDKSFS